MIVLPDVVAVVCGREYFALVNEIHFERLEDLRLHKVANSTLGHHWNVDRLAHLQVAQRLFAQGRLLQLRL